MAERGPQALAQALPGDCPARQSVDELRALGVQQCVDAGVRHSPLGVVAEALRTRFCGGDAAVLLRADMKARIYQAFAGLDVGGSARAPRRCTLAGCSVSPPDSSLTSWWYFASFWSWAFASRSSPTLRHMRWGSGLSRRMVLMALTLRFIWATMMCTTCTCHRALGDRIHPTPDTVDGQLGGDCC